MKFKYCIWYKTEEGEIDWIEYELPKRLMSGEMLRKIQYELSAKLNNKIEIFNFRPFEKEKYFDSL